MPTAIQDLFSGHEAGHYAMPKAIVADRHHAAAVTAEFYAAKRAAATAASNVGVVKRRIARQVADDRRPGDAIVVDVEAVREATLGAEAAEWQREILSAAMALADRALADRAHNEAESIRSALRTALDETIATVRKHTGVNVPWSDPTAVIVGPAPVRAAWEAVSLAVVRYAAIVSATRAAAKIAGTVTPPEFRGAYGKLPTDPRARLVAVAALAPDVGPWIPEPHDLAELLKVQRAEQNHWRDALGAVSM